ncbi:MAG: 6-carboxytetrahydropterin synthase [bacterium]|jgi:6-pyruvoyltetrahydropterin/6-carboxytetrahydropterin synthase|nr:6-carboxytetrahydropterin synthase [bacterium]
MLVELTRRASFCAAHRLYSPHLTEEENQQIFRQCGNPHGHGHNYKLEVTIQGPVDPKTGMVMNLEDLDLLIDQEIIDQVDHRHLNHDVPFLAGVIPTIENMVIAFWRLLDQKLPNGMLKTIRLWESENSYVTYSGPTA